MFFSASPARTPLASSRAIRSRVGVDRASRVRGRPPSRALVTRARVEPRVLEDDSHARRRANAVSVASPPDAMREERRRALSGCSVDGSIDDDGDVVPARAMTSRIRRPAPREPPVRLLTHYDAVVDCIVHEMDRTAAGDRVEFSVYVLEPGESTLRVLAAMRRAAGRGVRVDCSLDCSVISAFTRWCEGTETWGGKLEALAAEFPALVTFAPRVIPTHAKYVMCHRAAAVPTAVFGGVNIGDRFRDWRDFAIRCEGRAAVGALALAVNGPVAEGDSRRRDLKRGGERPGASGAGARPGAGGGSVDGGGGHARARISRISRVSCVSRVSKSPLESCHPLCLPQDVTRDETIASAIASTAGSHASSRFRASSRRSDGGFAVPGRVLGRGGARRRFGFHHEPTHGIRRRRVGGAVVAYVPGGV